MSESAFKIVLSRKGFDSESGGCASPIFPNGRFYSLPIDFAPGARKRYCDIGRGVGLDGSDMGSMVEHLTPGKLNRRKAIRREAWAHLDPDLDDTAVPRLRGWRAGFGQVEQSQVHLANEGVGPGDVLLFHGWFREVTREPSGRWWYRSGAPDLNLIFGWLQVAEVIDLERERPTAVIERYPWMRDHPHLHVPPDFKLTPPAHAIYVGTERLRLPGIDCRDAAGAGVFRTFDPRLVLTAPGESRSVWKLPKWFRGGDGQPWLTNYPELDRWTDAGDAVILHPRRGRRGQEAILNCARRPEAASWVVSLITGAAK